MGKNTGKKIVAILSVLLILMSIPIYVSATTAQTRVNFDGRPLTFDVSPRTINGRIFVQYRPVAEASGASINWDPANGRITVRAGEASVVMTVGLTSAVVNGRRVNIEATPVILNGHTMVPLRFVAESLGYELNWVNGIANINRRTFVLNEREGTRLIFDRAPRRIISLSVCTTSILHGLGITPVGMNTTGAPLPAELGNVPEVGMHNNPNIEKILTIAPDLVIAPTRTRVTLTPIFTRHNIRAMFLDSMTLQETMDNVRMFGRAFDREERANQIIDDIEARRDSVLAKIRGQQPIRYMAMLGHSGGFAFMTADSLVGGLIGLLGGINVTDEIRIAEGITGTIPFSVERAVAINPEVILKVAHAGTRAEAEKSLLDEFRNNPVWRNTSAVRNNRVHMLDSTLITHMSLGLSIIDAFEHVADVLYPQAGIR